MPEGEPHLPETATHTGYSLVPSLGRGRGQCCSHWRGEELGSERSQQLAQAQLCVGSMASAVSPAPPVGHRPPATCRLCDPLWPWMGPGTDLLMLMLQARGRAALWEAQRLCSCTSPAACTRRLCFQTARPRLDSGGPCSGSLPLSDGDSHLPKLISPQKDGHYPSDPVLGGLRTETEAGRGGPHPAAASANSLKGSVTVVKTAGKRPQRLQGDQPWGRD